MGGDAAGGARAAQRPPLGAGQRRGRHLREPPREERLEQSGAGVRGAERQVRPAHGDAEGRGWGGRAGGRGRCHGRGHRAAIRARHEPDVRRGGGSQGRRGRQARAGDVTLAGGRPPSPRRAVRPRTPEPAPRRTRSPIEEMSASRVPATFQRDHDGLIFCCRKSLESRLWPRTTNQPPTHPALPSKRHLGRATHTEASRHRSKGISQCPPGSPSLPLLRARIALAQGAGGLPSRGPPPRPPRPLG